MLARNDVNESTYCEDVRVSVTCLSNMRSGSVRFMSSKVSIRFSPEIVISLALRGLSHDACRLTRTPSGYLNVAKTASSTPGLIQLPPTADAVSGTDPSQ